MKRTTAAPLVIAAIVGIGVGFLTDQMLTSAGRATFTPTVTLPILLILLGAVDILLAVPIRRATRGISKARRCRPAS